MQRRTFLRAVALVGTAGAAGCTRGRSGGGTPGGSGRPTGTDRPAGSGRSTGSTPRAGAAAPPTAADWTALGRDLGGRLVRPGDADYGTARLGFNPRYDGVHPAGIAYCAGPADVRSCLAFAARHGVPVVPRAGGHSYAGASTSTGLVVDVTPMRSVTVDAASGTATVGAGARLVDVYAVLAGHGRTIPAGSCPTVGLAGLALGGGVGVVGRAYGLTSDSVVAATVVTTDGRVLDCDAGRQPDLFWACRGGGGGNFGVLTSLRLHTHPAPAVTVFFLSWRWPAAARVVDGWQRWGPAAPDPLWSTCKLLGSTDRPVPSVLVAGLYLGPAGDLDPLLDGLVARVGVQPAGRSVRTRGYAEAMLAEAGCAGRTVAECHLPWQAPGGRLARESLAAASHFIDRPLPADGIALLVRAAEQRGRLAGGGEGGISLDALGGAINRVPPDATAFVHRGALFLAQLTTTWADGAAAGAVARQRDWLRRFRTALRPYGNGEAYQNYADPELTDWRRAYYAGNYGRLVRVKARYDPGSLLRPAQGIPPR
jgi:FAD/FMN-containing dehydrogenase